MKFLTLALLLFLTQVLAAADALKVMQRAPEGELQSVEAAREVVITFNFPMVALSSGEDSGNFCPIEIEPPLPGRCRWRGTNTLAYEFASPPGPGRHFKVLVPEGTKSQVGGQSLEEAVSFEFTTLRPRIQNFYPRNDEQWLGLTPNFFLQFNVSINAQVAGNYLGFYQGDKALPIKIQAICLDDLKKAHKAGKWEDVHFWPWDASSQILLLSPEQALQKDTKYQLKVKAGWPAEGGEAGECGLATDFESHYHTYGSFKFLGPEGEDCSGRLSLQFSNPIFAQHLGDYLKVSPSVSGSDTAWDADNNAQAIENGHWRLYLSGWGFQADTLYHMELAPGISDAFGNQLEKGESFDWHSPSLCPSYDFRGGFGVMESYYPSRHPLDTVNTSTLHISYRPLDAEQVIPYYRAMVDNNALAEGDAKALSSADYSITGTPNLRSHTYIDLERLMGSHLNFAALAVPSRWGNGEPTYAIDNITDLGLTLKSAPESTLIWITSLKAAEPEAGIELQLRDANNKILWKGKTDESGLAQAPGWKNFGLIPERWTAPELFLLAHGQKGWALLSSQFREGVEPWRFRLPKGNFRSEYWEQGPSFDVFADRGIYRPGETLHFKGIVREVEQGDWAYPQSSKHFSLRLMDSRGQVALSRTAELDDHGLFDLSYPLPADAPTGEWNLMGSQNAIPNSSGDDDGDVPAGQLFDSSIRIEAVKTASYELELSPLKPWIHLGDSLDAEVQGHYFAGSGMPGALGDWSLNLEPSAFQPAAWSGWTFSAPSDSFDSQEEGDEGEDEDLSVGDEYQGRQIRLAGSGSFVLNSSSGAEIHASTKGLHSCSPCQATLEVNLTSPDRQKLFVRESTLLHEGQAYPGLLLPERMAELGQACTLSLVVVDPDGRTLSGRPLHLSLVREEQQNVRTVGALGRLEWRSERKLEKVGTWDLQSSTAPIPWIFKPEKAGQYRLRLKTQDEAGHSQSSGSYLYAYGPGEASWEQDETEMIELVPDKTNYQVGEVAHVMVKSPFPASKALVTIEREGILKAMVRQLGPADAIDIPITEAMLPNVYVGVALAEGRASKLHYNKEGEDLAKPQSRFGYTSLEVKPLDRKLSLEIEADKDEYRPGDEVQATIKLRDSSGQALKGDLTVFAVDEGVLSLTDYKTPDPFEFFYGDRDLQVGSADNRLAVIGARSFGEKGQDRGGGGAARMAMAMAPGVDLRRKFESSAFWNASLQSDANGIVQVRFQLPDNLTRFRLVAVAAADKRFGSATQGLKVNQILALRPSLPRFMRWGDHAEAGVSVQNNSAQGGDIVVSLSSSAEIVNSGPLEERIHLGPGEAKELRWPLEARALGQGELLFQAKGMLPKEERDALLWKLPISAPEKPAHAATMGVADAAPVLEKLDRPSEAASDSSRLKVSFASTAMLGLRGGMDYLRSYPYYCLEQKLSCILPAVVGSDLVLAFHLASSEEAKKQAQEVLNELPKFQVGGGGYYYWPDAECSGPDPWLTAYALNVAAIAKDSAFKLPEDSLQKAGEWLSKDMDFHEGPCWTYSDEEKDVVRAMALYGLYRQGIKLPGLFTELYGRRTQLSLYSLADLLRAAPGLGNAEQAEALRQMLLNQAQVDPRGMHFELPHQTRWPWIHASDVALTGLCLDALLEAKGSFPGDEKVARWLSAERGQNGAWADTQSNAWAFLGLTQYFRTHETVEPHFEALMKGAAQELFKARFEGRSVESQSKEFGEAELFPASSEIPLTFSKDGAGRLYYDLLLSWIPKAYSKPDFEGFEVTRSITDLDGHPLQGPFKAGQRYQISLNVKSQVDRSFVALSDFLPAGFEIVDSSLATESQTPKQSGEGNNRDSNWSSWWGNFERHENYDDRIFVFADYLGAGSHDWKYLVQATTPGKFEEPSAWVEMMYQPEVYARSAATLIEVQGP